MNGKSYRYIQTGQSYDEAKHDCEDDVNAHAALALFKNEEDYNVIINFFGKLCFFKLIFVSFS